MFMGEFDHNIDKKGRIIIPARFREEFGDHVVINRGLDGCLNVYTIEQWQDTYRRLSAMSSNHKDVRMFARMMLSKAAECEIDAQGRVLIPASLIQLAKLQKACKIVGVATHVEIWAKDVWEKLEEEQDGRFEEVAENMPEFSL